MTTQPSVKKNYIFNLLYQVLLLVAPFVTTPYVSRVLGADGVGIYSYTSSIMSYFMLFALLGVSNYGVREIARVRDNKRECSKVFWEIAILVALTTTISLVVWICLCICYEEFRPCFIALTPILVNCLFDVSWFFTGHEQLGKVVLRNSIVKIVCIALLFVLVRTKDDLVIYILLNSAGALVGSICMCMLLPRMIEHVPIKELRIFRHIKETLIFFLPTLATSIYTVLDKTLIGIIVADPAVNGYYEQSAKVIEMGKAVTYSSLNIVMASRMSYLYAQQAFEEIHLRLQKSMNFILCVGFCIVFGIAGVAEVFVPMFFGDEFMPVITLLYVMCPLIVIIGVSNCLASHYYMPCDRQPDSTKFVCIAAGVNLVANLVLIPQLGALGAAIGSLIAEILATILFVVNSKKQMTWKTLALQSWRKLIAGALMCAAIMFLGRALELNAIIVVFIQMSAGLVIYVGLLALMRDEMIFELGGIASSKVRGLLKR